MKSAVLLFLLFATFSFGLSQAACAYDQAGDKIYEQELRNFAGHSPVWFTYYENGAVKKAEWSSAPDAGIQWYKNISNFSDSGTLLNSTDHNYDDSPATLRK